MYGECPRTVEGFGCRTGDAIGNYTMMAFHMLIMNYSFGRRLSQDGRLLEVVRCACGGQTCIQLKYNKYILTYSYES